MQLTNWPVFAKHSNLLQANIMNTCKLGSPVGTRTTVTSPMLPGELPDAAMLTPWKHGTSNPALNQLNHEGHQCLQHTCEHVSSQEETCSWHRAAGFAGGKANS